MPTRIICIMNQKGGVGKTTTALNLGAALAKAGKYVLLIDLDPQANLTHGLGCRAPDLAHSIYELLTNQQSRIADTILHTAYERLDIVPSHIDLSGAEIELVPAMARETRLKRAIDQLGDAYDYILIDCLPSLSLLTVNAMVAAKEVMVPLQAHPFALEGLGKLFEVSGMLREALNPELKVSGVLVTLFDSRTIVNRETYEQLQRDERLAPHIFETVVKTNVKIAESQSSGIPVIHYDPACAGALAYTQLAEEVLEMETGCLASRARRSIEERNAQTAPEQPQPVTTVLLNTQKKTSHPEVQPPPENPPAVHDRDLSVPLASSRPEEYPQPREPYFPSPPQHASSLTSTIRNRLGETSELRPRLNIGR